MARAVQDTFDSHDALAPQIAKQDQVATMNGHAQSRSEIGPGRVLVWRCSYRPAPRFQLSHEGGSSHRSVTRYVRSQFLQIGGGAGREDEAPRCAHSAAFGPNF